MTELKCPFCGQELKAIYCGGLYVGLACKNVGCLETKDFLGSEALWQELILTRKALDVATKCINWVIDTYRTGQDQEADVLGICEFAAEEINQIKTTTEKDK